MDLWLQGFQLALSGPNTLVLLLGTLIGLVVGILPVVGPSFGVTLALPFTFGLDPAAALILLTAIQSASAYGDSIASVLLNVPGGPGTVATCWEGYPLSRKGRAGTALGVCTLASFVGGIMGWLSLAFLAAPMTAFALMIGAPEYFVLGIMALCLIAIASRGETIKGLMMGCMGLVVAMIGADPITGLTYRFTFGLTALEAGVQIVLGALAVFAIPQIIEMLEQGGTIAQVTEVKDSVLRGVVEALKRPITLLRGGVIGWLIGIMPAIGTSAAGITAYLVEKGVSREKEQFGQGSIAGLTAAETGKGACILGDGITSLMLGVPGSVTWAILMAALIIHGVQPGPRFMTSGVLPYTVFAGLLLGQLAYFLLGLAFVKHMARLVYIPNQILAPMVTILTFLGAYVAKNYVYDILIMTALGIFSFAAVRSRYPTVPLILGFILGDLIEANFHRALGVGFGSATVFLKRPISVSLILITLLFAAWPWIANYIRRTWFAARKESVVGEVLLGEEEKGETTAVEVIFSGVLSLILLASLITSLGYSPQVRLFPVIVSIAGLILNAYWLVSAVLGKKIKPLDLKAKDFALGQTPWRHSLALLLAYAISVLVIGLIPSSVIYFVAVAALAGYRKWRVVGACAVGIVVFLVVFAQALKVALPAGLWGG